MASLFHARRPAQDGRRRRWLAASAAGVLAGATAFALSAAPATAAPAPSYHAGQDAATFSVLGVTDANCFLGIGGNQIWIKPGDTIDFDSSLAGLDLGGLRLSGLLTSVAGLHVAATIDKGLANETSFTVGPTGDHVLPALNAGEHTLDWSVDSISVLPILPLNLGKLTTISLTKALGLGAELAVGAKLNWHGTIHVSDNAANCALPAVSVPGVQVTAGKVKATTPQVNVDPNGGTTTPPVSIDTPTGSAPTTGTHDPGKGKPGTGTTSGNGGSSSSTSGTSTSAGSAAGGSGGSDGSSGAGFGNALPDTGGAGGGGFGNAYPDTGGGLVLGNSANSGSGAQNGSDPSGAGPAQHLVAAKHNQQSSTAELAAELPTGARMPVLLAILAIIALALVTATYARLYLLRRG